MSPQDPIADAVPTRPRNTDAVRADVIAARIVRPGGIEALADERAAPSGLHMLVSMPALNEAKTIADVIGRIPRDIAGVSRLTVLVIDDGSTDRTAELSRAAGAVVVSHGRSLGVGAAFQNAITHATAMGVDLLVSIDSDGQFNPADIPALIAPVLRGEADFTSASRFKDPAMVPEMPAIKKWGNHMMSRLISGLASQKFHDVSCGMRCYSRHAMLSLNLMGRFTYTQEVFLNLAFKRFRIVEVPIRVRGQREHGQSRVANNLWKYAVNTSRIIFRCYRDYQPMRFFGFLAMAMWLPAAGLCTFLLAHYLNTGNFTPHKWAAFTSGGLFVLGLMMLYMGLIGDMLNRHRIYLEELLYRQRLFHSDNTRDR